MSRTRLYLPTGICKRCRHRSVCHDARQHVIDRGFRRRRECPYYRAYHRSVLRRLVGCVKSIVRR